MSEDETYRVHVVTPDSEVETEISSPEEWDFLVNYLDKKIRQPLETQEIKKDNEHTDTTEKSDQ